MGFAERGSKQDLAQAVSGLCDQALAAVQQGFSILVLSDRALPQKMIPLPALLAVSAVAIAIGLVILVIYLFLGSVRATIVPAVTVPVSIIASFIVLNAFGFSVNLLSLLALVLAIGLVVDDAIVVLENIHRRMEQYGESRLVAAFKGTRQVAFAVVATTVVLVSVFLPIVFVEGVAGQLFRDQALTVAFSLVISLIVAAEGDVLTVTEKGYGKRTPVEQFPTKGRGGLGIISIRTSDRNGEQVGAVLVNEGDEIMLITDGGTLVRTRVTDVSVLGRDTQGVKLIRLSGEEKLAGIDRIEPMDEAPNGEGEGEARSNAHGTGGIRDHARSRGWPGRRARRAGGVRGAGGRRPAVSGP